MTKKVSTGVVDPSVVIKKPAPANRSHLQKSKKTVQSQSAPSTPAVPNELQRKLDALKKPLKDETDDEDHPVAKEPVSTSRGRRSCKDAPKAWASLMKGPAKPKRNRVESTDHDDENEDDDESDAAPPPPKIYSRPQVARRGGHHSLPLSVSNANRLAEVPATPKGDVQDHEDEDDHMNVPDVHEDEFKMQGSPSKVGKGRGRAAGGTRGGRHGNPTPRVSVQGAKSPAKPRIKSPLKSPTRQAAPQTSSKTLVAQETKEDGPQTSSSNKRSAKSTNELPDKTVDEFNKIIATLQAEVQRVTEHRQSSIEHLEQSYTNLLQLKDQRITDLEKELQAVQDRLQNTISNQVDRLNGGSTEN